MIHKQYFFDPQQRRGGEVYLWKSLEAAKKSHDETYRKKIREAYGTEPAITYYEGVLVVDNVASEIYEDRRESQYLIFH